MKSVPNLVRGKFDCVDKIKIICTSGYYKIIKPFFLRELLLLVRVSRVGCGGVKEEGTALELVSKELNHFGVIADLFRQIGGHSSRFVLFCSF